jgi:hypothetical protein
VMRGTARNVQEERNGKPQKPAFTHRHKRDGTFVSVCPVCFQTVETSKSEDLLAARISALSAEEILPVVKALTECQVRIFELEEMLQRMETRPN